MLLFIDLLSWKTWTVPLIGAFIGWITNWLAIKMLINFGDIKDRLSDPDALSNFKEEIAARIEDALRDRIEKSTMASILIPEQLIQSIHKTIVEEIEKNLPEVISNTITKIEDKLNIEEIVTNKVNQFSDEKLEQLLLDITAKEFTFIEIIGGVLGFLIGIIQLLIAAL